MARPLVRDSPPLKDSGLKPNQVSETSLYGVPIVSLVIDGKERLCLAQISNTLLKNYSYNEIHNRRVALGITCVQCTPVQLELLRRAGAMPISSRRCGMITKREAERLCKSFLGEHSPPKLPENFAFDVSHDCAWGCRGSFIPARYNSSRAKCIKCSMCSMYFSPNKFIFHSHRTPEARYLQPDAANFNSWRRHLRLTEKKSADDISHAWEDVKAMFNGGSRKRTLPPSPMKAQASSVESRPDVPHKSMRCEDEPGPGAGLGGARSYPVIPVPSKSFSLQLQKLPPPLFPPPYPFPSYGLCPKKSDEPKAVSGLLWPGPKELYPAFPVFWPGAGGLPVPPYLASPHKPPAELGARQDLEEPSDRSPPLSLGPAHEERCSSSHSSCTRTDDDRSGDESAHRKLSYVSAFRPVVRDAESIAKLYGARSGHVSPDFISEGSSLRSASPERDTEDEDPDVDVDEPETPDRLSPCERAHSPAAPCANEPVHPACTEDRLTRTVSTAHEVHAAEKDEHAPYGTKQSRSNGVHVPEALTTRSPARFEESSRADGALRIDISVHERDLENMAKEELQKQLVEQVELRKKLEREFQHLKDNFQDQMKRELSYREEMVQQLQIVRAHDALQHFSCKMLGPRQCSGACTFKPPLLPP